MAVMGQIVGNAPNAAKLSLLQMVQQACSELGLQAPLSVIGNTDQQVIQLLALANREARDTFQEGTAIGGWQALRAKYRFNVQSTGVQSVSVVTGSNVVNFLTTPAIAPQVGWEVSVSNGSNAGIFTNGTTITAVNSSTQVVTSTNSMITQSGTTLAFGQASYPFPVDVSNLMPSTFWDRSMRWQVEGPLSPQDWQSLKSGIIVSGPRRRYRVMDGSFWLDPVPADNNTLEYEYYSYNYAMSVTGAAQSKFLIDTDIYLLDDDVMILGIIWRFRRAKGLDYAQEQDAWQDQLDRYKARQASAKNLPLNATVLDYPQFLGVANIPDSGFGTP